MPSASRQPISLRAAAEPRCAIHAGVFGCGRIRRRSAAAWIPSAERRSVGGRETDAVVIVTGSILGTDDTIDELIRLSLEHVHRSRTEPGCISHAVHRDVEEPNRLMFVERWESRDALHTHFAVPASGA